ncbi:hypothetical protein [Staphylococcus nepalensis]|uniref:hypothetical protein n=1 Tax=Staphylococcus nepalensis TaxID=214473 RepID=UPI0030180FF9
MAYEYESSLKNRLLDLEFDTWEETAQFEREYRELERVYRKAKAWEKLKEEKMNDYITWSDAEKRNDLFRMDKLDGTNEFRNLLSDLEDE